MSGERKVLIGVAAGLVGAALAALSLYYSRSDDPLVDVERIERRHLEAVVSASGTVEPQLSVDISSSVMGRVTRLDVNEGERIAVVTLDGDVPGVRPGFTATADITTATRTDVVAVPIQSTTVREVGGGAAAGAPARASSSVTPAVSAAQLAAAAAGEPEEAEGVFAIRDGRAVFVRIETGIAGDRYFEALTGLADGDLVVTGPFDVVRALEDGDPVRIDERPADR